MNGKIFYKHLIISGDTTTPRWIIFAIDLIICAASVLVSFLLRFNFVLPDWEQGMLPVLVLYVLIVRGLMFIIFRTYLGLIRYTSIYDAWRIFMVVSGGTALLLVLNLLWFFFNHRYAIPNSVLFIDYMGSMLGLICSRIMYKMAYHSIMGNGDEVENVLVVGDGQFFSAIKTLDDAGQPDMRLVGIVDSTGKHVGQKLGRYTINSVDQVPTMLLQHSVDRLVVARNALSGDALQELVRQCRNRKVRLQTVDSLSLWILGQGQGQGQGQGLKDIQIEDLLGRPSIALDMNKVSEYVSGKTVLVTGAAGSIGQELVNQLTQFNIRLLVLFDHAETPLYELDLHLRERKGFFRFELVIGNITNPNRVRKMFEVFHPQVVFHAAAYKHVPMMEENPSEAVFNNVLGTKVLADLALEFGVQKFVMISTDKAVNPTNVMGASKRIAEIYTQTLGATHSQKTQFITTRFGNVLGSNGSVIPRFKRQIDQGGPITITHPEITRYFMTIPEACQLVLEAGALGQGGEIFIFDMGEPVKILTLAQRMLHLSGLIPGRDIQISFTGLRPGEKLYEELLNDQELTLPTHHSKIMVAKVRTYDDGVLSQIQELISLLNTDNYVLVRKMKEIVPEFISQNSVFQNIDRQQHFSQLHAAQ